MAKVVKYQRVGKEQGGPVPITSVERYFEKDEAYMFATWGEKKVCGNAHEVVEFLRSNNVEKSDLERICKSAFTKKNLEKKEVMKEFEKERKSAQACKDLKKQHQNDLSSRDLEAYLSEILEQRAAFVQGSKPARSPSLAKKSREPRKPKTFQDRINELEDGFVYDITGMNADGKGAHKVKYSSKRSSLGTSGVLSKLVYNPKPQNNLNPQDGISNCLRHMGHSDSDVKKVISHCFGKQRTKSPQPGSPRKARSADPELEDLGLNF